MTPATMTLIDSITTAVTAGNILWLGALLIVVFFINIKHVKVLLESNELRKRRRLKRLLEAKQSNGLDENLRQFLHEEVQYEHFLLVTGIGANKPFRDKLIEVHQYADSRLKFLDFKHALPNLRFEHGKLYVHLSVMDWFIFWMNWCGVGLFALLAWLCALLAFMHQPFEWRLFGLFVLVAAGAFGMALFFILANRFWFAAKRIQQVLAKLAIDA